MHCRRKTWGGPRMVAVRVSRNASAHQNRGNRREISVVAWRWNHANFAAFVAGAMFAGRTWRRG